MKELEDYEWFPRVFRQFQTDYIGYVVARFGIYDPLIRLICSVNPSHRDMFDLCSGSGEPAISLFKRCGCFDSLTLSDKFPQHVRPESGITYDRNSLDVLRMDFSGPYIYTMFNAFHHFTDTTKKNIVSDMIQAKARVYIVEILEPRTICLLKVLFASTVGTLVLTPWVKPFSWKRLLLTYIFPVNIFTITYDGVVSVCKSRSEKQYRKLFNAFGQHTRITRDTTGLSPLVIIQVN